MNKEIKLSYITVTKNKLPYLKACLEKLIAQKKPDEEILIADGASTDGTPEYLAKLKQEGEIDDYISEQDYCESHALNKLFLKVHGTLIKIINDDDVYFYPNIEKCKEFMLSHPDIDILGTDGGSYKHKTPNELYICQITGCRKTYNEWQLNHTPFNFSVLGIMFRRSSLPVLGFWNLSFRGADTEYTYRVTAGKANVGWYTGSSYVYIKNEDSVVWAHREKIVNENIRLEKFYLNKNPEWKIKKISKQLILLLINLLMMRKKVIPKAFPTPWPQLVVDAEKWLREKSQQEKPEFMWKQTN